MSKPCPVCGGPCTHDGKCVNCETPQPLIVGPDLPPNTAVKVPLGTQTPEGQTQLIYSMTLVARPDIQVTRKLTLSIGTEPAPLVLPACAILGEKEAMRQRLLLDFESLWDQLMNPLIHGVAVPQAPNPAPEPDWHAEKMRMAADYAKRSKNHDPNLFGRKEPPPSMPPAG